MQAGAVQLKLMADIVDLQSKMREVEKMMGGTTQQFLDAQKAAEQMNRAMAGVNTSALQQASKHIDQVGVSARQTANAMRMIPMQMTDIAVGLGSGQSPFTVLLQQGGQLKDSFGGVGEALKGVGRYMMGLPGEIMALVNPFTAAAAGAAVLGVAYNQGSKEADEFRKQILLTGNASGVSADQMASMAQQIGGSFGVTTAQAAQALAAMAGTSQIAGASLKDFASTAVAMEQSFGISISETAKNFSELGKDPVGASKRLNESMNYLTAATYSQIKAAIALGEEEKAASLAQDEYSKAMKKRADDMKQNLGVIETSWKVVSSVAKDAWDNMLGIGRASTIDKQMADLATKINRGFVLPWEDAKAMLQEYEDLRKKQQKEVADAAAQGLTARANKDGIAEVDKQDKLREESARKAKEAIEAAARAQQQLVDSGVKLYGDLIAKESGLAGDFAEKWSQLSSAYAAGRLNVTQLTEAQAALLAQQPAMVKAREDEEKLLKRINDEQAKMVAESWKQADALQQQIDQQTKANATYGMGKSALAELTLAEMEHQMAALQATDRVMPGYIESLQQRIDKQRELIGVLKQGEFIDANAKAAKQAAEDWKRYADQINQSLTDSLMRGFEAGKGFAQSLKDAVVNMFKTMVLRPVVQFIVGGVTGALGLGPGTAMAGQGGLMQATQLMNVGTTISNVYSSITGSFAALGDKVAFAAQDIGAWLTTNTTGVLNEAGASMMANSGAMGSFASAAGGVLAGYGIGKAISGQYSAIGSDSSNAVVIGTAAGAAIGSVVPVLGTAIGAAIGGALGGAYNRAFGMGATEIQGQGLTGTFNAQTGANVQSYANYHKSGGWFRSDDNWTAYTALSKDASQFLNSAVTMTAKATQEYARLLGINTDAIAGFSKSINISLQGLDAAGKEKAIAAAISGFGEDMAKQLAGLSAFSAQGETASATLVRLASALGGVNDAIKTLGQTALSSSLAGADAADKLIALFGGMEQFTQSTAAYYLAYYSEAERSAATVRNLADAFGKMGMALPATTNAFRALVDAQDLSTEAGRRAYAVLMTLAPSFAEAVKSMSNVLAETIKSATPALDAQIEASRNAAQSAQSMATDFRAVAVSMRDAGKSIYLQSMGIRESALMTASQYRSIMDRAQGGDMAAMQSAGDMASQYVANAQNMAATRVQYMLAAAQAAADLELAAKAADTVAAGQDWQAKIYGVNTQLLEATKATLTAQEVNKTLLEQQVQALAKIDILLADSKSLTGQSLEEQAKTQANTDSSNFLLQSVQSVLQATPGWATGLTNATTTGNRGVIESLSSVVAAINQQAAAQKSEIERQQNLAKAQASLEAVFGQQKGAIASVNAGVQGIWDLASRYGVSLQQSNGSAATFGVDAAGKFTAAYDQISGNPGSFAGYKSEFYKAGGVYDQTYGMAGTLQDLAAKVEEARSAVRSLGGVPAFAAGGLHTGGLRIVGENGPELEATGPARIYNASQTRSLLSGGGDEVTAELRALREEVSMLRAEARATAVNTGRSADLMKRVTRNGEAMTVQTDGTTLEVTAA